MLAPTIDSASKACSTVKPYASASFTPWLNPLPTNSCIDIYIAFYSSSYSDFIRDYSNTCFSDSSKAFKALAFPSKHLHLSTLRNFTNFADSSGMTLVWLHSCLSGFELQTLLSTWWSPTLSTVVAVLDPSSTHQNQEGFPQTLLTLWLIDLHSLQDSTSLIYQLKVARLDWLLSYSDFCRDMIIWLAFCCQFATRGKFA